MTSQLKSLHAKWNTLTGQELKYGPAERQLWDWINNSFTEADLETILTFLFWQNAKREPKYRTKIQFHRLVGDLELANSLLAEASAWQRNRVKSPSARAKVLASFRNDPAVAPTEGQVQTFREAISKAIKGL